jgi:hypothetical protein
MATERGRCFEVSKVRVGANGSVSDVLWGEVAGDTDQPVSEPVLATVAEVVDAIHDGAQVAAVFAAERQCPPRAFAVFEHPDGSESIAFDGAPSAGRDIADMDSLDD